MAHNLGGCGEVGTVARGEDGTVEDISHVQAHHRAVGNKHPRNRLYRLQPLNVPEATNPHSAIKRLCHPKRCVSL